MPEARPRQGVNPVAIAHNPHGVLPALAATVCGFVRQAAARRASSLHSRRRNREHHPRPGGRPSARPPASIRTAVHIYIVNDPTLNSFVAGGQNLFLNTGTLLRSQTPNQLIGIMAHETGHIAGGHLARSDAGDAQRHDRQHHRHGGGRGGRGRRPQSRCRRRPACSAARASASAPSWRSRSTQEASADQAALTFLDRAHQSARGLLQFFEILAAGRAAVAASSEDPYLRDHPLTQRTRQLRARSCRSIRPGPTCQGPAGMGRACTRA